jgi:hypothetical protein
MVDCENIKSNALAQYQARICIPRGKGGVGRNKQTWETSTEDEKRPNRPLDGGARKVSQWAERRMTGRCLTRMTCSV